MVRKATGVLATWVVADTGIERITVPDCP
jgi:hypothetical protein